MSKPRFIQIEPGKVQCTRCNRIFATSSPPDKVFCVNSDHRGRSRRAMQEGVGTELAKIIKEKNLDIACADCAALAAELNRHTPDEIAADRAKWIKAIRKNFRKLGKLRQFWLAVKSSPAAKWFVASKGIDGAIGEMLQTAIDRARSKQSAPD